MRTRGIYPFLAIAIVAIGLLLAMLARLRFQRAPDFMHVDPASLPQALQRGDEVATLQGVDDGLRNRGIGSAHRNAPDRIRRA